jgi:hypothetical protein
MKILCRTDIMMGRSQKSKVTKIKLSELGIRDSLRVHLRAFARASQVVVERGSFPYVTLL